MTSKVLRCRHKLGCKERLILCENSERDGMINVIIRSNGFFGSETLVLIQKEELIKELKKLEGKK